MNPAKNEMRTENRMVNESRPRIEGRSGLTPALKNGGRGLKQMVVRIIPRAGVKPQRFVHQAPQGKCWTEGGVQELLENVGTFLEKTWPDDDFRIVKVGHGAYNFVFQKPEVQA